MVTRDDKISITFSSKVTDGDVKWPQIKLFSAGGTTAVTSMTAGER